MRVAPRVFILITRPGNISSIPGAFYYATGTKLEVESMYRTLFCNDICDKHIGQTVSLAGWVDVVRDHGGVLFVDLRDYTGITQVGVHDEKLLANAVAATTSIMTYCTIVTAWLAQNESAGTSVKVRLH